MAAIAAFAHTLGLVLKVFKCQSRAARPSRRHRQIRGQPLGFWSAGADRP